MGVFIKLPDNIGKMRSPVKCKLCNEENNIYDLGLVNIIQRFSDCSVFKTPCCNKLADDREWKSLPDFTRIENLVKKYRN